MGHSAVMYERQLNPGVLISGEIFQLKIQLGIWKRDINVRCNDVK